MAGRDIELNERRQKRKFIHFEDLILYEDERLIVVNKPAGLATLQERGEGADVNMLQLARKYHAEAQVCHRLDKTTTGVLVFARDPDAYRDVSMQFTHREVVKHYLALVHGAHDFEEVLIEAPLSVSTKGVVRVNFSSGKDALTVVDTEEKFRHYTLVSCQPLTGRTHQIRVHLSSVGCPIVGDALYGGQNIYLSELKKNYKLNRSGEEKPLNEGFLLHASGIRLRVPGQEEERNFIAPFPEKFEVVLKTLRKYEA